MIFLFRTKPKIEILRKKHMHFIGMVYLISPVNHFLVRNHILRGEQLLPGMSRYNYSGMQEKKETVFSFISPWT